MKITISVIKASLGGRLLEAVFVPIALALGSIALSPIAQAVSPPPDGGYPGGNTAEGQNTLFSLTTGTYNTAVGWFSLRNNTEGQFNTSLGAGALLANTEDQNTAIGAGALLSNTTGFQNTANGAFALFSNTIGSLNTATGAAALFSNTTGADNTAIGYFALGSNTTGTDNTGIGFTALDSNTDGSFNTAIGFEALYENTTGADNTGIGYAALISNSTGIHNTGVGTGALASNIVGAGNTAIGDGALYNNTGDNNTALGAGAGINHTTGSNNIYIGDYGSASESNVIAIGVTPGGHTNTYIDGIFGVTTALSAVPVVIASDGQLGTISSSRRFKKEIKPMDETSESILALKPVTFQYKRDTKGIAQFGLIAEEVAEVNPDLVVRDRKGEIYSVRYDAVNAMLLNEFLKEHKRVEEQQATIGELKSTVAQQQKGMEVLTTQLKEQAVQIQKVSGQLELKGLPARMVLNNQ